MSVRAVKAGGFEFLTKPFDNDDLLDAIRQALDYDRRTVKSNWLFQEADHVIPEIEFRRRMGQGTRDLALRKRYVHSLRFQ
jgi:FixJ family two-component response regulator